MRNEMEISFDAVSEGITEDTVIRQIIDAKEKGLYA